MSAQPFQLMTASPSSAVATNGTISFAYPSGASASDFAATGAILVIPALNNVLEQGTETFSIALGDSAVTLTYLGATSIPASDILTLQLANAAYADITLLTDSSGGTAADTIAAVSDVATAANGIASVAAKLNTAVTQINELKALLQDADIMQS